MLRVTVPIRDVTIEEVGERGEGGGGGGVGVGGGGGGAAAAITAATANHHQQQPASSSAHHLADLDFGPGCDACEVVGRAGDRRVVATKDIKRGDVVVFEAPLAAVKAGEPVSSRALARTFGALAGRWGMARGGGGGVGEGEGLGEEVEAAAGANVPHEWILAHRLLKSGALGTRPPREWAREYVQAPPACADGAAGGGGGGGAGGGAGGGGGFSHASFDAEVAAEVAAEVGGGVTSEDVSAVHRAVCANAFALVRWCML